MIEVVIDWDHFNSLLCLKFTAKQRDITLLPLLCGDLYLNSQLGKELAFKGIGFESNIAKGQFFLFCTCCVLSH